MCWLKQGRILTVAGVTLAICCAPVVGLFNLVDVSVWPTWVMIVVCETLRKVCFIHFVWKHKIILAVYSLTENSSGSFLCRNHILLHLLFLFVRHNDNWYSVRATCVVLCWCSGFFLHNDTMTLDFPSHSTNNGLLHAS